MRGLLALLLMGSACTSLDVGKARAYPCTADAECRGGWVCGLEGLCHPPEGGPWKCGPDGGDQLCFGWVCGLEQTCHAPESGAWLCDPDAGDAPCYGWHCGLGGRCYPRDAGVEHACRYELEAAQARSDCDLAWRCGRDDRCHPIGAAAPYACLSDLDCEAAWRCGPAQRCLDPGAEAPPPPPAGAVSVERIFPVLIDRRPDRLASAGIGSGGDVSLTFSLGAELTHLFAYDRWFDGGWTGPLVVHRATLAAPPDELVNAGRLTLALKDGELQLIDWDAPTAPAVSALDAGFAVRRLQAIAVRNSIFAVPLGDTQSAAIGADGVAVPLDVPLDAGETLVSVVSVGLNGGLALLAVATSEHVLTGTVDGGFSSPTPWIANSLRLLDGGSTTLDPLRRLVRTGTNGSFPLLFEGVDGRVRVATVSSASPLLGPFVNEVACAPCPSGQLLAYSTFGENNSSLTSRCTGPQGDQFVTVRLPDCQVILTTPFNVAPPKATPFLEGATAEIAASGRIAASAPGSSSPSIPITPVAVFNVLASGNGYGTAHAESQGRLVLRSGSYGWVEVPGLGMSKTLSSGTRPPRATLRKAPQWSWSENMLCDFGSVAIDPAGVIPCSFSSSGLATSSFAAATAKTPAGRQTLLVAENDSIQTAAAPSLADAGARLLPRVLPFPSVAIQSVTLNTALPDSGAELTGYALSFAGVSQLQSFAERSWSSTPIPLPAGEWMKLLEAGTSTRVAYSDGRLVTLPSRLDTAQRLPGGTAYDFETLGDTVFAATDAGLYQLASATDGGVLARWVPVPLPPASSDPGAPVSITNARFFGGTAVVWLAFSNEAIYRLALDAGR